MNKLQVLTFMNILDHKNCKNEKIKSRRKKKKFKAWKKVHQSEQRRVLEPTE